MPDRRSFLRGLGSAAGVSLAAWRARRTVAAGAIDVRGPVLGPLLARNHDPRYIEVAARRWGLV